MTPFREPPAITSTLSTNLLDPVSLRFLPSMRLPRVALIVALVGGIVLGGVATPVQAQRSEIPRNPDAELLFEQGVSAFEQERYSTAYERFRLVTEYPLNRTTTAALFMAGKSLYRMERYRDAVDLLRTLTSRYPETTYAGAADAVIEAAREGIRQYGQSPDTLRIGVALPLSDQDAPLTQALFNGVRLAVDHHNGIRRRYVFPPPFEDRPDSVDVYDTAELLGDSLARADGRTTLATSRDTMQVDSLRIVTEQAGRPSWVAKLYFRETEGSEGARAAVDSLIRIDQVDVILGPLYSETARTAGSAADRQETLLVAPLATDASVSEGRDYVFQTNPVIALRGQLMARFATTSLLTKSTAVIFEKNNRLSREMARGFREEAERRQIDIPFVLGLQNARDWSRLPAAISADTTITDSILASTESVYLPMSGRNAAGKIQDALTGLERLPLPPNARVLGNAEWHDLSIEKAASAFTATYSNDFYVDTRRQAVQRFIRSYRLLTGSTPDDLSATGRRLAYTGYDVARYVMRSLRPGPGRPGPEALQGSGRFDGLGTRIDFQGGNVNQAMFFHRYRNNRLELVQ